MIEASPLIIWRQPLYAAWLNVLLVQREESIVPLFSRRNLCNWSTSLSYGKHHGALPKCLTKKIKKVISAFFIFCRNRYKWLRLCISSFDASRYCAAWLIVWLAQGEESIVPPFFLLSVVILTCFFLLRNNIFILNFVTEMINTS